MGPGGPTGRPPPACPSPPDVATPVEWTHAFLRSRSVRGRTLGESAERQFRDTRTLHAAPHQRSRRGGGPVNDARSVVSEVEVPVDPTTAFTVFTDELDLWWVRMTQPMAPSPQRVHLTVAWTWAPAASVGNAAVGLASPARRRCATAHVTRRRGQQCPDSPVTISTAMTASSARAPPA